MKNLFIILFLLLASIPAFAADALKDVPRNHPAKAALDDLLARGIDVTTGNPDGTYRGDKWTSKYDITYLVHSLYLKMRKNGTSEVDISDIKEEIKWLRSEISNLNEASEGGSGLKQYGSIGFSSKFGSVVAYEQNDRAPLGPETNYRFIYSIEKELGDDARLKANIDTMDGAFNSATQRGFPVQIIDLQGDIVAEMGLANPVKIKAIIGPGSVQHRDTSGVVPSEDYTYFSRPRTSFFATTKMGALDVGAGYAARDIATDGKVGTSEVNISISGGSLDVPLFGTAQISSVSRYMFVDFMDPTSMPNNFHEELTFSFAPSDDLSHKLTIGASATDNPLSQFFLNYEMSVKEHAGKGSRLNLYINSVGADYRLPFQALELVPENIFNRKIMDDTVDIAIEVIQPMSPDLIVKNRTDWVGNHRLEMDKRSAGTSLTNEISVDKKINKHMTLNVFYRYYYVPSRIAQFSAAVPEFSDVLGIGVSCKF